MDSLTPPRPPLKEDSFEMPPLPITIDNASPFEQSMRLSATSTPLPLSPLGPMEAHELFCLAENSDDISEILDRLEPNQLLLRTWSYFQHCQRTARQLEKEARFQRDLADSLLGELRQLQIDEVLRPVVLKSRRREQQTTHFARPSNPRIRAIDLAQTTANSTFEATPHSPMTTLTHDTRRRTNTPNYHRRRRHDLCVVFFCFTHILSIIVEKKERTTNFMTNKPLCSTDDNRPPESGIFGLERG
jgi:hypothetical protein